MAAGSGERAQLSAGCFVEHSAKLFGERASRRQIGKTPTIMVLLISRNGTAKVERDAPRLVKIYNLTVQFDIQSIRGDGYLDNKGIFLLVGERALPARSIDI